MRQITKRIAQYGHGDQIGFNMNKNMIYNFLVKHNLTVYEDSLWKYNKKLRVWNIIWPKKIKNINPHNFNLYIKYLII